MVDIGQKKTVCLILFSKIIFEDVWNDFMLFLKNHPGEMIIMQLNSHTDDDKNTRHTRKTRTGMCRHQGCLRQQEQKIHIIFNSVAGRVTHKLLDYAWGGIGIDPEMNPALKDILDSIGNDNKVRPLRVGAVLLDFYNKHRGDDTYKIVERIINFNFTAPFIAIN